MAFGGSTNLASDETFDLLCRVCKHKDKNIEAEKYCVECQDYFCSNCVKLHEALPTLTWHKILDKSQFPSGTSRKLSKGPQGPRQSQPPAPIERCQRHAHNCIDMYCQNHDDVGCATCMAVDHRLCKDTFYIPEFIQNNPSTSGHCDVKKKLDTVAVSLKVHRYGLQREKDQLIKRKAELIKEIQKFRKEINKRIDALENNSIADVEEKYKSLVSQTDEELKKLDASKINVKSAQDKIGSTGRNVSQDFVNAKKGKNIAGNASQCIEDSKACTPTEEVDFTPHQRIPELLRDLDSLGRITHTSTGTTEATATSDVQSQNKGNQAYAGTVKTQHPDALLQAKGSKKYCVKVKSDQNNCDIISACTLEDGTIILSDKNNNKLKRLDSSTFAVRDYYDLPGYPWQVCTMSRQEVAACLPLEQVVQFISAGSRITKTKEIKTDFQCFGLAYSNGSLYLSDFTTSVYIYSISGSKLQQYSRDQSGQRLFCSIMSLAVSRDGSMIYVSDAEEGLIVLDSHRKVVEQYSGRQLQRARDCYLISTGSLLVCGRDSHNVLQFGPNGDFRNEVLKFKDKAVLFKAICCNHQTSKMLIGGVGNDIEVYDLVKQGI